MELWVIGWGCFVVILAVLRARRRRLEWRNQPGLSVVSPHDPSFIGPLPVQNPEGPPVNKAGNMPANIASDGDPARRNPSVNAAPRALHVVPPDVSEFVISDFRAQIDICQVDLCYPDIDFMHWRAPGLAAMMFTDGEETLTVYFQGLDVVPFDGVFVRFDHPRKGPQSYLLSDLLDVRESEISEEEAALRSDARRDAMGSKLEDGVGPMEFHDFDTSKECIEVFVPEGRLSSTAVSISTTPDGSDGLVLVDGRVAAVLIGAVDAGPRNVKLVAVDQTAAA